MDTFTNSRRITKLANSGMDTLRRIRRGERITELTEDVSSRQDLAYITVELQKRDKHILIVKSHSRDIVRPVLKQIDPDDSGYIFFASELMLDPLNNCMVPEHRIATKCEIDGLLSRKIPLDRLPVLRMVDPIRRWHNFPRGSIIAIERADDSLFFRRVV